MDVTDEFHRHVKHAAFLDRISMTEPVLCVLSPEVDRILGDADQSRGNEGPPGRREVVSVS